MANSCFRFKQFSVYQDRCAMKVGTDGVLLGAWADVTHVACALDIGTGTGLIALMLAQKNLHACVDAIDIDIDACRQASENVFHSPFSDRVQVYPHSLETYAGVNKTKYDLIVSNPPYFSDSLKSPEAKRTLARHNDSLPLSVLLSISGSMLKEDGRIAFILPPLLYQELGMSLAASGLFLRRVTEVIPVSGGLPKRYLVELSANESLSVEITDLTIEESRHQYTPEYVELTKDFYLKM